MACIKEIYSFGGSSDQRTANSKKACMTQAIHTCIQPMFQSHPKLINEPLQIPLYARNTSNICRNMNVIGQLNNKLEKLLSLHVSGQGEHLPSLLLMVVYPKQKIQTQSFSGLGGLDMKIGSTKIKIFGILFSNHSASGIAFRARSSKVTLVRF